MNQLFVPTIPTPTVPARIHRRQGLLRRAEVVTVTSFADTSTAASTASAGNKVPIGPIVGGIVAGIVAVCLVSGIWWWCHHKAEQERKERKARLIAKAARSTGALSARPSLTPKDTDLSMKTLSRPAVKPSMFGDAVPAVSAVPYESRGSEQGNAGSKPKTRRTPPSVDASGASPSANTPSRRHRHERSLSKEPASPAPVALAPVVQAGIHRYQPARPSPLALAAKSQSPIDSRPPIVSPTSSTSRSRDGSLSASGAKAGERRADETVPKWGQKPFRSAGTTPSDPSSPTSDVNAVEQGVGYVNEDSEDDDPFEHAKYDRHRSTASTHASSIAGSTNKRDTVRQSRDRDVMGGIAEWQEEIAGGRDVPSHQRGPSYPYPPQQGYTSQRYQEDGNAMRGNDPFNGDDYRNDGYR